MRIFEKFNGYEVTEFLDHFEEMCDHHEVYGKERVTALPSYCVYDIHECVKFSEPYRSRDWALLARQLRHDYADKNTKRHRFTEKHLCALREKLQTDGGNSPQIYI